ncbi:hypothetical protein GCM10018790_47290 [Kitasatospora xanthocidica]|nr:hypothetical protein GCM10018790_47290 [Kitasatospora xanthocidica]
MAVAAHRPAEAATRATAEPIAVAVRRERGFRAFVDEVMTIPWVRSGPMRESCRGDPAEQEAGQGAGAERAPDAPGAPEQHGARPLTRVDDSR